MRLSKIDLSSIVAVGHSDGYLGLLIDRGEEKDTSDRDRLLH